MTSEVAGVTLRLMTVIALRGQASWTLDSRLRHHACYVNRFQIGRGSADIAMFVPDIPGELPIACHRWGTLAQSMWRQTSRYLLITVSHR
ncbi:MAG: hypothetical protein CMJ70_00055 [Planctomycetaceae bacterium]|nr:hypothetical protein [Planctomycetaceae bacterium]